VSTLLGETRRRWFTRRSVSPVTAFQRAVHLVHVYPFVVVIEKHVVPPDRFVAPRRASLWEPFDTVP
jgi:hypothetical protein